MRRPLCLVCLIFVILIIGIVEIFPYEYEFSDFASGEIVLVEGKVAKKEFQTKNGQIVYSIYLEQIVSQSVSDADNFSDKYSITEKINRVEGIICYMGTNSYVPNIGSLVQVQGEISAFSTPDNPGEFDAPLYYKIKGIDLKMYECKLVAYSEEYSYIEENLFRLKQRLCEVLDKCFSAEYSGIAKAILLAMNGEIGEETKELYQKNGMLHILCVSGLHISILGMGLFRLLKKLRVPKIINTILCIGTMCFYGIMLGMGTSVFRAVLMFSMKLVAKLCKRTYDLLTAACVGIFCILLEQPLYIYHSGFLLSFLSVVALGAFSPIFPEKVCKVNFINKRMDSFFSSLTIWLVTLPVYGRYYYEVSVSGLLLNVIILPFVSAVLVQVIGVCLLGGLSIPLGSVLARLCECFLWGFETIFEGFDKLGYTTYVLGNISLGRCILYYVGFVILLFCIEKWKKRYWYVGLVGLCAFLLVKVPKELTITCLSVGQGDCAVVEYKDLVCVIDAGSSSEKEVAKYTILPFLKYQGIREIDYLFLTHSDTDHINAVETLLLQSKTGISIKSLVVTDCTRLTEYGEIATLAQEQEIPIYEISQGDFVSYDDLSLQCISPNAGLLAKNLESNNEASMVLLLEKGEFCMLFTGDMEGEGEEIVTEILQKREKSNVTILKVAHHGSKNSSGAAFLSAAKPWVSVISCGENNLYGHPHTETLTRLEDIGSRVLVTKEDGAVTIRVKKKEIVVEKIR